MPEPFDENREIAWTPTWSLTYETVRWVPTVFCYLVKNRERQEAFCQADSNGCASGNTLEEAILHGFFEVVERDAMAIFWYSRAPRPAVNLESFEDSFLDRITLHYGNRDRNLTVLDITTDLGIPCFAAVSGTSCGGRLLLGLGAHLNARVAVSRAVAELNQMDAIIGSFLGSDSVGPDDSPMSDWLRNATTENQPYLIPVDAPVRIAGDFQVRHSADLLDDIHACVEIARGNGLETIVLDLTREAPVFQQHG